MVLPRYPAQSTDAHPDEINTPVWIGTQYRACDTTGTATDSGYTESAYNLDVALRLADLLRQAGANVVLTRTDDKGWGPCIDERAAIGNRANADVGIAIHADGGPADGRGFHVIYPPSIAGYTDNIAVDSHRLALGFPPDGISSPGAVRRSDMRESRRPAWLYAGGGRALLHRR